MLASSPQTSHTLILKSNHIKDSETGASAPWGTVLTSQVIRHRTCYGLNDVSPKLICWRLDPLMWFHLETGSSEVQEGLWGQSANPKDPLLCGDQEESSIWRPGRALSRNQTLPHLDFRLSILQKNQKTDFCCLSHPVYGMLCKRLSRLTQSMKLDPSDCSLYFSF